MATIQPCAPTCQLVRLLLRGYARSRGISLQTAYLEHGIPYVEDPA